MCGPKGGSSPSFSQPSPMTTTQAVNQATNQTQSYAPNQLISQVGTQALMQANNAAQTPFSLGPQQIAQFTPMQQQYFNQLLGMQGMTNPYFQGAQNIMGQGLQGVNAGMNQAGAGLGYAQQGFGNIGTGMGLAEQGIGLAQQGIGTSNVGLGYAQRGYDAAGNQIPGVNQAQQAIGTGQNILTGGIGNVGAAGQAVTSDQISRYLNPYAQSAFADMSKYIFDPQRVQTMGGATQAAGGVGADRLALTQLNLDKTQADALAQAEAGFYQPAMQMAEQQKQMALASGLGMGQLGSQYGAMAAQQGQLGLGAAGIGLGQGQLGLGMGQLGLGQGQLGLGAGQLGLGVGQLGAQQGQLGLGMSNVGLGMGQLGLGTVGAGTQYGALGTAAQNAALQATGALGTAGTQQQALNQAQLNALYQNQLMQQAYPFQAAQFLGGMTGGLAPAFGGTTTGQGTTAGYGYGTQMPSQPSYGSQLLGLGTAGVGLLGSLGTFGGFGGFGGGTNAATPTNLDFSSYIDPTLSQTYGARGGRVGYQDGGSVDDVPEVNVKEASIVPNIPLPMGSGEHTGAHLNLNPDVKFPLPWAVQQQQQSGGGGGGSGIGGIIGGALSIGKALLPFLAQGGAVNPFSAGQGYQEGGDIEDTPDTDQPMSDQPIRLAMADTPTTSDAGNIITRAMGATAQQESGGNYRELGPVTKTGDRAYGKYQVMGENIPVWTEKFLGQRMTPQEYLSNPAAQDAVYRGQMGEYINKYGLEGAGRAWLGGPGAISHPERTDQLGTSVGSYGQRFAQLVGGQGGVPTPMGATATDQVYTPLTREQMPYPGAAQDDWGTRAARSPWMSLIAAGAKMATSTQPLGSAIASGIGAGGAELESQRKELATEEAINQRAEALHHQAEALNLQYTKMTPYQAMEAAKPVVLAQTVDALGRMRAIYGQRMPDGTYVDPITRKPIDMSSINPPVGGISGDTISRVATPEEVTSGAHAEGTHPEVLNELAKQDPGLAATVKAIDEGRQNIQSAAYKDKTLLARYVNAYDPNWNQQVFAARQKQLNDLTSNGNAGKLLMAVNQLWPHLQTASKDAEMLDNSNYPAVNTIANWWATQTGDPRIKKFDSVREVAALDAARLLRGSGQMAEKDIEQWRTLLANSGSPRQLQGVISQLADDLMTARVGSIEQSYRVTMGKEPPKNLISDEARNALNEVKNRAAVTEARDAIDRGSPRDAVINDLRARGIDPTMLGPRYTQGVSAPAGPAPTATSTPTVPAPDRYKQLRASGMDKASAYARMHQEGY